MAANIQDVLAYELKKEIADRYFGFRKLIEEDKLDLTEKFRQYSFILEKRISFDLIRIYILLKDEELIQAFLDLIKLRQHLFYDPYLVQSQEIRNRVFEGVRIRGLTRFNCFRNLVEDCYERLAFHVERYREKFEELMALHDDIDEEIKVFYRQNDLGTIMGFLRSLGNPTVSGGMEGGMEIGLTEVLERKLAVEAPLPIEHYLPLISPLPPYEKVAGELKELLKRAFPLHSDEFLDSVIARTFFPLWR